MLKKLLDFQFDVLKCLILCHSHFSVHLVWNYRISSTDPLMQYAWVTSMNPIPFLWYRAFTETSSICPTLPPPNMNFGSRSKVVVPITRLLLSLVVTATNILWSGFVFTSFSFALAGASRSCPRGKFSIYF